MPSERKGPVFEIRNEKSIFHEGSLRGASEDRIPSINVIFIFTHHHASGFCNTSMSGENVSIP
jgi:hypothetical protein